MSRHNQNATWKIKDSKLRDGNPGVSTSAFLQSVPGKRLSLGVSAGLLEEL